MKKKKINWGEYVFLAVILGYLVYYLADIYGAAFRAAFWPYCLMGAVAVLVLIIGVRTYIKAPVTDAAPGTETTQPTPTFRERAAKALPIVWIAISFAAYALLLKQLGFVVSTLALTMWLSWYLGGKKIKTALLVSVCLTGCLYLVFRVALGMKLPSGKVFDLLEKML